MMFRDREDAGRFLAEHMKDFVPRAEVLVLGLPRGGVPVAFEVARRLGAPLDVFVVRKLGVPGHEELAMGAIATGGVRVLNEAVVSEIGISPDRIDEVEAAERAELERRERAYREGRPPAPIQGRTVILVDDGLATGATMRAAVEAVRRLDPAEVVVAVPVAAAATCEDLRARASLVVCASTPERFYAVGQWYEDFSQTTDDEVRALLRRAAAWTGRPPSEQPRVDRGGTMAIQDRLLHETELRIPLGESTLAADWVLPDGARGAVLFAHGSGSSRHSPRNRRVARILQEAGFATLLLDLLTRDEEAIDDETAELRFDIPFLARRLVGATDWLLGAREGGALPVGYFGASTGAAAALVAAAERPTVLRAVVSRGGRPDLAGSSLRRVQAPTLLVVGSLDLPVIRLNREAYAELRGEKRLEIVQGATHLFEEPGALDEVARLARDWFLEYLVGEVPRRVRVA